MALFPSEVVRGRPVWLLDLQVGGELLRIASEPITVQDADGVDLEYVEGLPDLDLSLYIEGAQSIDLEADRDWSELWAAGIPIERQPATLRRIYRGQILERARVLISGVTQGVAFGFPGAPGRLSFTIRREERLFAGPIPPAGHVIDDTTWPVRGAYDIDDAVRGYNYPVPIGAPGVFPGQNPRPAVPALGVDAADGDSGSRFLVGGFPIAATTLRMWDTTTNPLANGTAVVVPRNDAVEPRDKHGRLVSLVEPPGTITVEAGRSYYVGFDTDQLGVIGPDGNGIRGAGSVFRWVLQTFAPSLRVDFSRSESALDVLDAYLIDTVINTSGGVNAWDWIQRALLPLLPVEVRQGESGIYLRLKRLQASRRDVRRVLSADRGDVERRTRLQPANRIYNDFRIDFAPERMQMSRLLRHRRLVADPENLVDPNEVRDERAAGSFLCRVSQSLHGFRPHPPIRTGVLWDVGTANRVLQDKALEHCLPRYRGTYDGDLDLELLERDDVVLLEDTAPGANVVDRLAIVQDVTVGIDGVSLELEVLPSDLEVP